MNRAERIVLNLRRAMEKKSASLRSGETLRIGDRVIIREDIDTYPAACDHDPDKDPSRVLFIPDDHDRDYIAVDRSVRVEYPKGCCLPIVRLDLDEDLDNWADAYPEPEPEVELIDDKTGEPQARYSVGAIWTDEQIRDLMTTAAEGGINYWAEIETIRREDIAHTDPLADDGLSVEAIIIERDKEDPRAEFKATTIGFSAIRNAIDEIIISGKFPARLVGIVAARDIENVDAEVADAVVQVATFGRLVYG